MKILIVGGAGYIGSHVVHAFLDNDIEVAVLDNFSTGSHVNVPKSVEVFEGTILDNSFLTKVMTMGWDGVVHLAALKAAGESMEKPCQYAVNNIAGTINLVNAMMEAGIPYLVFSSSAAIFGEPIRLPIDEDHPKSPESFYGFTKLEIERLLDWYDRLKGLKFASLRYFNAAGYDIEGRVVEPEKDPQNMIPILMEAAVGTRKKFLIYGNDYATRDGTCIRDYVHVSDLANAHVLAMNYFLNPRPSIKLNLGSETGISVAEMVQKATQVTGIKINYEIGSRRMGDPAILIASSQVARKILGWKAVHSDVKTLIRSSWNIYKRRNLR